MQKPFKRIAIIGLGLIGGSLGLAIKKRFPSAKVTGLDKKSVLIQAKKLGAIDYAARSPGEAVRGADLVVLCTPVGVTLRLLPKIAVYCPHKCVITDTGSVKSSIVKEAAKLFRGNFVGGHPMAGSEKSGIKASHPSLFRNAPWILTPTRRTPTPHLRRLKSLLKNIDARVAIMDAQKHDKLVSRLSHIPQLVAVALVNFAVGSQIAGSKSIELAGGGFRDMTRIASSEFDVWADILSENSKEINEGLRFLIKELALYARSLDKKNLRAKFDRARQLRESFRRS